jgi:hypothetical protein
METTYHTMAYIVGYDPESGLFAAERLLADMDTGEPAVARSKPTTACRLRLPKWVLGEAFEMLEELRYEGVGTAYVIVPVDLLEEVERAIVRLDTLGGLEAGSGMAWWRSFTKGA